MYHVYLQMRHKAGNRTLIFKSSAIQRHSAVPRRISISKILFSAKLRRLSPSALLQRNTDAQVIEIHVHGVEIKLRVVALD